MPHRPINLRAVRGHTAREYAPGTRAIRVDRAPAKKPELGLNGLHARAVLEMF